MERGRGVRPGLVLSRFKVKLSAAGVVLASLSGLAGSAATPPHPIRVLMFDGVYGYRHGSIDTAQQVFSQIGRRDPNEFQFTITDNPQDVNAGTLAHTDVLMFMATVGDIQFSKQQYEAILNFMRSGHGFFGVHAASDGNYVWAPYAQLLGAYWNGDTYDGYAVNTVEDPTNPIVSSLGRSFNLYEEYYKWQLDPRPNVHVLTSLDTGSLPPAYAAQYPPAQPTSWCHYFLGGRSIYFNWGHFQSTLENPKVIHVYLQAIRWAAGRLKANCGPTGPPPGRYQAAWANEYYGAHRMSSTEYGADDVLTDIQPGGWVQFDNVNMTGVCGLAFHVAAQTEPVPNHNHGPVPLPAHGGKINVHLNTIFGPQTGSYTQVTNHDTPVLATVEVPETSSQWATEAVPLAERVTGVHNLDLYFHSNLGDYIEISSGLALGSDAPPYNLFSLDWMQLLRGSACPAVAAGAPRRPSSGVSTPVIAGRIPATEGSVIGRGLAFTGADFAKVGLSALAFLCCAAGIRFAGRRNR